jgi:hypothetical protein
MMTLSNSTRFIFTTTFASNNGEIAYLIKSVTLLVMRLNLLAERVSVLVELLIQALTGWLWFVNIPAHVYGWCVSEAEVWRFVSVVMGIRVSSLAWGLGITN